MQRFIVTEPRDGEGDPVPSARAGDVFLVEDDRTVDEDGDLYGQIERTGKRTWIGALYLTLESPAVEQEGEATGVELVEVEAIVKVLQAFDSTEQQARQVIALARLVAR